MGSLLRLAALLIGVGGTTVALADATLQVMPTGPRAGETTLRLTDSAGRTVAPNPGSPNSFSNLAAGQYSAVAMVGGNPLGQPTSIRLEEGRNEARVSSATGAIELLSRQGSMQQQQQHWGFGVLGGWKRTPFDGSISSSALGMTASGGLEETGQTLALEARYYLRQRTPQSGLRFFGFGSYNFFSGLDTERALVQFHPGTGNDSGVAVEEKDSIQLGAGARWMASRDTGLEALAGLHRTRITLTAFSNEMGGGGPNNRFTKEESSWDFLWGLGLTHRVFNLSSGRPVSATVRYTAARIRDMSVSGMSPFTGSTYTGRVNGGWNQSLTAGLLF